MKERNCSRCGTKTSEYCQVCIVAFPARRDAKTMTPAERVAELKSWAIVEIPFTMIHQRIEELVGRSVWTHGLGNSEQLYAEIENGSSATFANVINKIPQEKLIVVSL
jgi:hypothetical protein